MDKLLQQQGEQPSEKPGTTNYENLKDNGTLILKNIFFDYDKSTIRDNSRPELDKLYDFLKENKDVRIEIGGHTDSWGNDEYNQRLSNDRANAVVNYLVKKGISSSRLVAKGYGETKPIAPNENPDGTDNPEGRQLNRRIEIKLLNYTGNDVKIEKIKVP